MIYQGYILRFEDIRHDVRIITIQLPKDQPFDFKPGQYIDLSIEDNPPRSFSIASAPRSDNTIDIHVRNIGQNVSKVLCSDIIQGQSVNISEAKGTMNLIPSGARMIFLAGGVGITPFLSMIEALTQTAVLYWGVEKEEDFYIDVQKDGVSIHRCIKIYPVDEYLKTMGDNDHIYISGPPIMIKDSRSKLLAAGIEASNIIYDE